MAAAGGAGAHRRPVSAAAEKCLFHSGLRVAHLFSSVQAQAQVDVDPRPQPAAPVLTGDQYRLLLGAGGVLAALALLGLINIFRRPRNAPPGEAPQQIACCGCEEDALSAAVATMAASLQQRDQHAGMFIWAALPQRLWQGSTAYRTSVNPFSLVSSTQQLQRTPSSRWASRTA